jgi:hypothetical protein
MIYGLEFSDWRWPNKPQTYFKTFERCQDKWLLFFQLTKLNIVEGKQVNSTWKMVIYVELN